MGQGIAAHPPAILACLKAEAGWNRLDQCWEFAGEDPTAKLAAAIEAPPLAAGHNSGAPPTPKPHYHGHRGRVRERVLKAGVESLADYELLELLLFYAIERIDTKPLAKRLLERFGTLGDMFAAEPAQLREFEIDQRTLVLFRAVREVGRRLAERKVKDMPVLTNWQQLIDYCHAALAHEKTEQFRILFLDRKNVLIADEVQQRGTIDHTPVYPREVMKRALELDAAALILVHNHPSGDPKPSRDDIEMTREIKAAAEALGIAIHDHLVIGRKGHASFRSLGLTDLTLCAPTLPCHCRAHRKRHHANLKLGAIEDDKTMKLTIEFPGAVRAILLSMPRCSDTAPAKRPPASVVDSHSFLLPWAGVQNGARDPTKSVFRESDLRVVPAVDVERGIREGNNGDRLAHFELEEMTSSGRLDDETAFLYTNLEDGFDYLAHNPNVARCCLALALQLQPSTTTDGAAQLADYLIERETCKRLAVNVRDYVLRENPSTCRRTSLYRFQDLGAGFFGRNVRADGAEAHVA